MLYALSVAAYEWLKRENRPPHKALVTYMVTVMAERLSFASKVIGVLRRSSARVGSTHVASE